MKCYPCKDARKPANSMLQNWPIISGEKVFACYDRQQKQVRIAA